MFQSYWKLILNVMYKSLLCNLRNVGILNYFLHKKKTAMVGMFLVKLKYLKSDLFNKIRYILLYIYQLKPEISILARVKVKHKIHSSTYWEEFYLLLICFHTKIWFRGSTWKTYKRWKQMKAAVLQHHKHLSVRNSFNKRTIMITLRYVVVWALCHHLQQYQSESLINT